MLNGFIKAEKRAKDSAQESVQESAQESAQEGGLGPENRSLARIFGRDSKSAVFGEERM